jgi:multicomponent Na+:H+ antiporter subunit G
LMTEYIGLGLITVGLLFDLFGCLGLVRLPDIYTRLQAATKTVTLGTCLILVGACVYTGLGPTGIKLEAPTVVDRYGEAQAAESEDA